MEPVFKLIGTLNGVPLYYTAPALLPRVRTEEDFNRMKVYLDQIKTKWIWIVDCSGLTLDYCTNMRYIQRLADILRGEHADKLQNTWMLHVNSWVRGLLKLFGTEAFYLSSDRLELFVQLQRAGCAHTTADFLLAKVAATPSVSIRA
jgi:hypothetical protein